MMLCYRLRHTYSSERVLDYKLQASTGNTLTHTLTHTVVVSQNNIRNETGINKRKIQTGIRIPFSVLRQYIYVAGFIFLCIRVAYDNKDKTNCYL